jgi:PKD repeat protein
VCRFVIEAPGGLRTNRTILFQDTSSDIDGTVVRYQWDFGDGTGINYDPDTVHIYRTARLYTVTHRVTDNNGGETPCTTSLSITN